MRHGRWLFIVVVLLLLTSIGTSLRIHELNTDNNTYAPGDTVDISGFIINDEDNPIANHQVELAIAYSPIYNPERAGNGETIQYREFIPFEIAEGENKYVNHSRTVGDNAAPGSYKIYYRILNENEDLQVFNTERFNVSDTGQEVRSATIDDLFFHQGTAIGYDLEGLRVSPNKSVNALMNITNIGTVDLTMNMSMDMQYTYDYERSAFKEYMEVTIPEGETREVNLTFMPPDTPTTYTPIFELHDQEGNSLGSTNGRLVVRGNSGRILRGDINNLTFRNGQPIELTADLIGPADYSGTIQNVALNYSVEDESGVLMDGERLVDLGGRIEEVRLTKDAPRSFANPNVTMVLSKNGQVYDRYTVSYTGGEAPADDIPRTLIFSLLLIFLILIGLLAWRWAP